MQNEFRRRALMEELGGMEDEQEPDPIGSPLELPAPGGMPGTPGNPNTGIGGTPDLSVGPSAEPTKPANDYSRLMGFDAGKLNDPNKHDFKYDTGRVMAQFDPRQGFTPEVIDALNKLDYGTFSGSGDKLSLSGAKNAKDAADFANQDWIFAHKANNADTKWNFGGGGVADAEQGQLPPGGGASAPGVGGYALDAALSGDPLAKIQAMLAQMSGSRPNFEALMAQLGGG